ncbi:hypothetical protein ULG90_16635 [Halopseudomonas pachastrellae]|nr:hypothetical protein ULG90_16635 [Halopseudomonas pachastrellae]
MDAALIRFIMGKPSDYGLPDPDYRMYESHPVVNSLVLHHLGHGDIHARRDIQSMDAIASTLSTVKRRVRPDPASYRVSAGLPVHRARAPELAGGAGCTAAVPERIPPEYDNLFMMGMIEAAGLGWEGRNLQARLTAL